MSEPLPFRLRPYVADDAPFIVECWAKSYRGRARDAGSAHVGDWKKFARAALAKCATLVCCLEDDPSSIVGFAVTRGHVILYVYVRESFRGMGVAKQLLAPYVGREDVVVGAVSAKRELPRGWRYSWLSNVLAVTE